MVISQPRWMRFVWPVLALLVLIVLGFAIRRVVTDVPNVSSGTVPDGFDRQYALHPALAYLHIAPAIIYLLGAPFQLNRQFREHHFTIHRRLGRVLIVMGLIAGVFAIVFGTLFAFGGPVESSAAIVFGTYFLVALTTAFLAIKHGDVTTHRRWMIRAFAIALAVGTIRIWVAVFTGPGLVSGPSARTFGIAFWLALVMHALAAELYLRAWPTAEGHAAAVAG